MGLEVDQKKEWVLFSLRFHVILLLIARGFLSKKPKQKELARTLLHEIFLRSP